MTNAPICPRCGRDLLDGSLHGLCPTCLLGVALAPSGPALTLETGDDTDHTIDAPEGYADPPGDWTATIAAGSERATAEGGVKAPATIRYFGDYELLAELGRGGMGIVYRARQASLNRPVALKLIRAGALAGADELRRFQNEAEAVALLDHPGIVPIYEVGEHDGRRYFSMKLVQGGNLADRLATYRDDPRAAAALLAESAEAVHHAHIRGILHRDLKPANILVDDAGHPHVTDFGLAKRVEADPEMTANGALLGTPAYMAPEQALGRRGAITTATDVHGLGSVLYCLLTGFAPFRGDSVVETLTKVKELSPDSPRKFNAKVPRDLEVICLKCLEKDPRRRYSSAQALADDVRAWLEGRPIAARPVRAIERAALFVRRRPALAAAYGLTAAVLVLVGFGGGLAWLWRAAEAARAEAVAARGEALMARDREARSRGVAERARDAEKNARAAAEKALDGEAKARGEIERQKEKLERFDYDRTIQVAHREWRENNVSAAVDLLGTTRPDLRGWEWFYLRRLCHSNLLTLKESTDNRFRSVSFSPDGSRIVTASDDTRVRPSASVKVWNAATGEGILTLSGHVGKVWSVSFSPDGLRIVTAGEDRTAKVWDARTGVEILTLKGHGALVGSAAFSPDGTRLVTASSDRTAKVWNATTGAAILTLSTTAPG